MSVTCLSVLGHQVLLLKFHHNVVISWIVSVLSGVVGILIVLEVF